MTSNRRTAANIRKEYEAELKTLQEMCPHTKIERLPFVEFGHYVGMVNVCKVCEKVIK